MCPSMSVQRMEIDFVIPSDCKLSLPLLHCTPLPTLKTQKICVFISCHVFVQLNLVM